MVLLDDIVEVLDLAQPGEAPQLTIALHRRDRGRIGRILVDRDRAWVDGVRPPKRFAEEPFRRRGIPLGREQEVNRLAPAVDGAIEVRAPRKIDLFRVRDLDGWRPAGFVARDRNGSAWLLRP